MGKGEGVCVCGGCNLVSTCCQDKTGSRENTRVWMEQPGREGVLHMPHVEQRDVTKNSAGRSAGEVARFIYFGE